jgi:putative ABC transport system ATP-binding protein
MMGSLARLRIDQFVTRHVGPIELSIGAAECVCIEGASGSGKTLLLRAIADLDPHRRRGLPRRTRAAAACRPRPGVIRWRWCWPRASGGQNGSATISTRASMLAWLAQLGLPDSAMSWEIARCSTGERQRLALLRTLMQAPAALLLDEPTGNLDHESTQRVEGLLTGYQRQRQAALLWVSHDAGQIERVAQRRFILDDGRLAEKLPR